MIVSHDLLPKMKKIRKKCPNIEKIIYLPDQLNPTDTTGFEGVTFYSFDDIVEKGKNNPIEGNLFKQLPREGTCEWVLAQYTSREGLVFYLGSKSLFSLSHFLFFCFYLFTCYQNSLTLLSKGKDFAVSC